MLSAGGGCNLPVTTRVKTVWKKFRELLPVLKCRNLSCKTRFHVYDSCVRSAMLHASESWPLSYKEKGSCLPLSLSLSLSVCLSVYLSLLLLVFLLLYSLSPPRRQDEKERERERERDRSPLPPISNNPPVTLPSNIVSHFTPLPLTHPFYSPAAYPPALRLPSHLPSYTLYRESQIILN